MHGLKLRPEFQTAALRGTVIEVKNSTNTGATQMDPARFLASTYPSVDLLKCLQAIAPGQERAVVLMGGRGQGKSHILSAAFHVLTTPATGNAWLHEWSQRLGDAHLSSIGIRSGFRVIVETLTNQAYKSLWDVLWAEHPDGTYYRGAFESKDVPVPPKAMLIEMFSKQPTALLLDEFQTWFDGLPEDKKQPRRTRAFNFIQTLSEIAAEHPDKLLLVVSVRDGQTDAYQQMHRLNPKVVDFTDPLTKRDRHRLLLHRIFENRAHMDAATIDAISETHWREHCRLRSLSAKDADAYHQRVKDAWPFSPTLLDLLDDQVLISVHAQETRDLIKLLVETFKLAGDTSPVLTAADFRIDRSESAVGSLLDAVASQVHRSLREKAQHNLQNVLETVPDAANTVPHAAEIISALWLRSFNTERHAGASVTDIQIDLTRDKPLDENALAVELRAIREASFNIHEPMLNWLVFKNEVNPEARLMANARNDKLFPHDEDRVCLARILHALLAADDQSPFRVLVLPRFWQKDPWPHMAPEDQPEKWDNRVPVIVVPESPDDEQAALGRWLKENLTTRRNTVRFLLPPKGAASIYTQAEMILSARAVKLAADWQAGEPEYKKLREKFEKLLQEQLKGHFNRFAVLDRWNFAEPSKCVFQLAAHARQGKQIPQGIQEVARDTIFLPEDFEELVLDFAARGESVGKLLDEMKEPRSGGKECIVWLGEREMIERIELLCAKGKLAINLRGTQLVQTQPGETESAATSRIKGRIGTGSHLFSTTLHKPGPTGASGGGVGVSPSNTAPAGNGQLPGFPNGGGGGSPPSPANPFTGGAPPVGTTTPAPASSTVQETPPKTTKHLVSNRNSPLNLTGTLEGWAAQSAAVQLRNISLKLDDMTGAQLASLLRKLPEGSYTLELDKEESA